MNIIISVTRGKMKDPLANLQLRSVLGACILLHHRAVNSELCSLLVSEYMTRES